MNNRRKKTNHGKSSNGIKIRNSFMRPMKKVRGKVNRQNRVVKIHSVSNTDFVLSTSFASYRIPRSFSKWFQNANQQVIQNVVCCGVDPSRINVGDVAYVFYWYGLDTIFDSDDFKQFEIVDSK